MRLSTGERTFDRRLEDIVADEVVFFEDASIQINGKDLNGRDVWLLVHVKPEVKVRFWGAEQSDANVIVDGKTYKE